MTAIAGTDRSAPSPGSGPVLRGPLHSVPHRGGRWLRRVGGAGATLGLTVFGLGAGLWLGSPASAAPPPVEVHMTGDAAGVFAPSTPKKLLDISHLVPGGSVMGTMQVRDASGHGAGSGLIDAISLTALNVSYESSCPLSTADCLAASHALANHLTFTLTPAGALGSGTQTLSLTALEAGAPIGTGMRDHDTVTVSLTASLDFASTGNDVQYGSVGFDLGLGLTSSHTGGGSEGDGGGGAGQGDGNSQGGPGSAGGGAINRGQKAGSGGNNQGQNAGGNAAGRPQVLGTSRIAPASPGTGGQGDQGNGHQNAGGPGSVLVLGGHRSLPNTGVPVGTILTVGGGILAAGVVLLYAAHRRSRA